MCTYIHKIREEQNTWKECPSGCMLHVQASVQPNGKSEGISRKEKKGPEKGEEAEEGKRKKGKNRTKSPTTPCVHQAPLDKARLGVLT